MDDLNHELGILEEQESPEPRPDQILGQELAQEFEMGHDGVTLSSRQLRSTLEALGGQLVWKVGKEEMTERIVVRVGYASATPSFRDLPKLHSATDTELSDAAKNAELVVEWIE